MFSVIRYPVTSSCKSFSIHKSLTIGLELILISNKNSLKITSSTSSITPSLYFLTITFFSKFIKSPLFNYIKQL